MKEIQLSEWFINLIENTILFPVRFRNQREIGKKRKVNNSALESVRNTLKKSDQLKANNTKTIFNVALYLLLLNQDILYYSEDLLCAIGDRRRAFISKQAAVLLYEAAEDLRQLLGREFREATRVIGASVEQLDRINSVSSEINKFWQDHREFLGIIRNALAAHRDHDSLRYADILENIKPLEVMNYAAELSQLLGRLAEVLTDLGYLTANPAVLVRDVITSNRKG